MTTLLCHTKPRWTGDGSMIPEKDIKIQSIGRYFKKSHIDHFGSLGLNVEFVSNGGPSNPHELDGEVKIFESWTKEFCYEKTYKIRWIKRFLMNIISILVQNCWALYQFHFKNQNKPTPLSHVEFIKHLACNLIGRKPAGKMLPHIARKFPDGHRQRDCVVKVSKMNLKKRYNQKRRPK